MTKTPQFPKFDVGTLVNMHKANVDTLVQAQKVWADTAQAIAKLQYGLFEDGMKNAQTFFKFDGKAKPDAVFTDVKAVAEKAMAVAKEEFDLGVKAQNEVAQLLVQRVAANIDELKGFAAA
jgi:hypothetical protein